MKCLICCREAYQHDFCKFHYGAYVNVVQSYGSWKKGLNIAWKDYLRELKQNCLTGEWARQIAEYLIKSEEAKNDKTN